MSRRMHLSLLAVLVGAVILVAGVSGAQDKRDDPNKKATDDAKKSIEEKRKALLSEEELKAIRNNNYLRIKGKEDELLIPQAEDIKFPAGWAKLMAARDKQQQPLTKEERKILDALRKPMDVELKETPLEEVIKFLEDKAGVKIVVPPTILEEKNITYKVPVSVNLKGVTLRTILKKTLADVGLVYIVKDNVIQVTTEERAKQTLTTRTYYMGDLLLSTGVDPLGRNPQKAQAIQTINDIIGVIVGTIEPDSWWVNGGPGRIVFDPTRMTLIVTQTAEVHYMMGLGKR